MKFALPSVALFAPFVGADFRSISDPDYTFNGNGYCMASSRADVPLEGPTANYYHVSFAVSGGGQGCANACRNYDLTGQIGFSMTGHGANCMCEYSFGWGPNGAVTPRSDGQMGGAYYTADGISGGGNGGTGYPQSSQGMTGATYYTCFTRNAYVYTTKNPTASPSKSPTNSPTLSPVTANPSKSPTGTPTKSHSPPTGTPTNSPTTSSELINSWYFPDWSKSNGGCKTGGGQPQYMTLAPQTWMFVSRNDCCLRYFGWMLNDCLGTSAVSPSGLWYPDWAGADDTCKNDGSEPEYMAVNPASWMFSTQLECCEANFGWMVNGCLGSSDPNAGASNKWYMVWDAPFKCKQDCDGTGPSCGGRATSWDELFETREACCADKAAWNPTDCLVD